MVNQSEQLARDLQPLTRRSLLKSGVLVGAAVSALGLVGCSSGPAEERILSEDDAHVMMHLARAMFPDHTGLFPLEKIPVVENVTHLLGIIDPSVRGDLSTAIKLFEYGAIVLGWHFRRFTQLDIAETKGYVERWQNGNSLQRGIATALKKLVYAAYWQDERTWKSVDFDGPVSDKWGLKKLGNAPLPVN